MGPRRGGAGEARETDHRSTLDLLDGSALR